MADSFGDIGTTLTGRPGATGCPCGLFGLLVSTGAGPEEDVAGIVAGTGTLVEGRGAGALLCELLGGVGAVLAGGSCTGGSAILGCCCCSEISFSAEIFVRLATCKPS